MTLLASHTVISKGFKSVLGIYGGILYRAQFFFFLKDSSPKKHGYVLGYRYGMSVRYGCTTILRKVGYGYGGDICFIKFFFIYYYVYIFYILISICEFKSNYG
jgi:hypothetical protein